MAKKRKGRGATMRTENKAKTQAQRARKADAAESSSKLERAFAKITPPKGFAIKSGSDLKRAFAKIAPPKGFAIKRP
jgi:hypothetical protein